MNRTIRKLGLVAACCCIASWAGCAHGSPRVGGVEDGSDAGVGSPDLGADAGGGRDAARAVDGGSLADDAAPVAGHFELGYDPLLTPKLVILDDAGRVVTSVTPAILGVIASTTWELVVDQGGAIVVVAGGSILVGGVELAVTDCDRLASSLAACSGDQACWNAAAALPRMAPALTCRPHLAAATCDPLPPPGDSLALAPNSAGVNVFEAGTHRFSLAGLADMVLFNVVTAAGLQTVFLHADGTLEERYASEIDWHAELRHLRTILAPVSGWRYERAMCTGVTVDPSCAAAAEALGTCLGSYLDGAGAAVCLGAIDRLVAPTLDNPYELDAYCTPR